MENLKLQAAILASAVISKSDIPVGMTAALQTYQDILEKLKADEEIPVNQNGTKEYEEL